MHTKTRIGSLNTIEVPGSENGPAIVCFHGFGANAEDLYPLHAHVRAPQGAHWFFPDAILELAPGMNPGPRAWWPIDEAALQYAIERGSHRDLSGFAPPGMVPAREAAVEMLRALLEDRGFAFDRITLMGFSQGAMLATELTLRSNEFFGARPAGLAMLSGTLLDEANWSALAASDHFQGFQFFQSHGSQDPILGFAAARKLEGLLRSSGWTGEFVEFAGGHTIPPEVVARLGQYLTRF